MNKLKKDIIYIVISFLLIFTSLGVVSGSSLVYLDDASTQASGIPGNSVYYIGGQRFCIPDDMAVNIVDNGLQITKEADGVYAFIFYYDSETFQNESAFNYYKKDITKEIIESGTSLSFSLDTYEDYSIRGNSGCLGMGSGSKFGIQHI